MREIVSDEATQEVFNNYRALYNNTFAPIDKLKTKLQLLKSQHNNIVKVFSITKDRDKQRKLKSESDIIRNQHKSSNEQIESLEKNLEGLEYLQGLRDIDTLAKFKVYIKSCNFWGESWAISILEHALNIKLILLSSIKYDEAIINRTSLDNVLYCGDIVHPILTAEGTFSPMFYIILDYNGSHFKLITYKKLGLFTFNQLPIKIKSLIKKVCEHVESGSYYLIPELKTYIPQAIGGKRTRRNIKTLRSSRKNKTS